MYQDNNVRKLYIERRDQGIECIVWNGKSVVMDVSVLQLLNGKNNEKEMPGKIPSSFREAYNSWYSNMKLGDIEKMIVKERNMFNDITSSRIMRKFDTGKFTDNGHDPCEIFKLYLKYKINVRAEFTGEGIGLKKIDYTVSILSNPTRKRLLTIMCKSGLYEINEMVKRYGFFNPSYLHIIIRNMDGKLLDKKIVPHLICNTIQLYNKQDIMSYIPHNLPIDLGDSTILYVVKELLGENFQTHRESYKKFSYWLTARGLYFYDVPSTIFYECYVHIPALRNLRMFTYICEVYRGKTNKSYDHLNECNDTIFFRNLSMIPNVIYLKIMLVTFHQLKPKDFYKAIVRVCG